MAQSPGGDVAGGSQPLVAQAVVSCPSCGAWSDVWADSCHCGTELLSDTRKLRLTKSGGEPHVRLERRAERSEASTQPGDWEQAVRDLAALRTADGSASRTPRIARLLLKLDRLEEALEETRVLEESGGLPVDIAVSMSYRFDAAGDLDGANGWIDRGLVSCGDDLKGRLPLVCERCRLLSDHGSAPEALSLLKPLQTELEAAIKKTERGGGAAVGMLFGADSQTYASGMWSTETATLKTAIDHAKGIVDTLEREKRAAAKQAKAQQRAAQGKTHWWQL